MLYEHFLHALARRTGIAVDIFNGLFVCMDECTHSYDEDECGGVPPPVAILVSALIYMDKYINAHETVMYYDEQLLVTTVLIAMKMHNDWDSHCKLQDIVLSTGIRLSERGIIFNELLICNTMEHDFNVSKQEFEELFNALSIKDTPVLELELVT